VLKIVPGDWLSIARDQIRFDMARTLLEMPFLERRPGWRELKAVQRDRIFVADGNQYFNRPGPRIVESLEMLAEIFHPELFPSRYEEGQGWMRYPAKLRVNEQSRGSRSITGSN
jgi:hypothetical protein